MFDQFSNVDRRLLLESLQDRAGKLQRLLNLLAAGAKGRGDTQRDYYGLQRLIEVIQQPRRPAVTPSAIESYLSAAD
jgi:hypothetical protein